MRWLKFFVPVFCACAVDAPLSVFPLDTRAEPGWDIVLQACDMWELECVPATDRKGSLVVILTDYIAAPTPRESADERLIGGMNFHSHVCWPHVWSSNDPYVLAHEMGHALGLEHVSDEKRLMHIRAGHLVTRREMERVHRGVDALDVCY